MENGKWNMEHGAGGGHSGGLTDATAVVTLF